MYPLCLLFYLLSFLLVEQRDIRKTPLSSGGTVMLMVIAWTGGVDASLSMDGRFERSSDLGKESSTAEFDGRLQMSHVPALFF